LTALSFVAEQKLYESYSRCLEYYRRFGEDGLAQEIRVELARAEEYVKLRADRVAALAKAD
jgi:hypothetical protein